MIALGMLSVLGAGVLTQFGFGMDSVQLLPGESSLHTLVRVLVLGCILCALGSSD